MNVQGRVGEKERGTFRNGSERFGTSSELLSNSSFISLQLKWVYFFVTFKFSNYRGSF